MECLVVFHGLGRHPLAFLLRDGFKHCFIAIKSHPHWIEIDALDGIPLIRVQGDSSYPLQEFYESQGFTVVPVKQNTRHVPAWNFMRGYFLVANCVGMVKAVLGLKGLVFSPYSLYKRLVK
jgi:hypothetical protein